MYVNCIFNETSVLVYYMMILIHPLDINVYCSKYVKSKVVVLLPDDAARYAIKLHYDQTENISYIDIHLYIYCVLIKQSIQHWQCDCNTCLGITWCTFFHLLFFVHLWFKLEDFDSHLLHFLLLLSISRLVSRDHLALLINDCTKRCFLHLCP